MQQARQLLQAALSYRTSGHTTARRPVKSFDGFKDGRNDGGDRYARFLKRPEDAVAWFTRWRRGYIEMFMFSLNLHTPTPVVGYGNSWDYVSMQS